MKYWYYQESGQRKGPISEGDIGKLFETGSISAETLVWTEGQTSWEKASAIESLVPPTFSPPPLQSHDAMTPAPPVAPSPVSTPPTPPASDQSDARLQAQKAEGFAETCSSWCSCASRWNLLGAESDARRCMQKAEGLAVQFQDWKNCFYTWQAFGDKREKRRCLQNCENLAKDSSDWAFCASERKELGDACEVRLCLQKAEELAVQSRDWATCASEWKELGDEVRFHHCRQKADALAKVSEDWRYCASLWDDPREQLRCCQQAVKSASDEPGFKHLNWVSLANFLQRYPNTKSLLQYSAQKVEMTARYLEEWEDCALIYRSYLQDENSAKRCERRSEGLFVRLLGSRETREKRGCLIMIIFVLALVVSSFYSISHLFH